MLYKRVNREEFVKTVKFFDPEFNVEKFKSLQKLFNYKRFDDLRRSVPLGVAFIDVTDYGSEETGEEPSYQGTSYSLVTPVNGELIGVLLGYESNDPDFVETDLSTSRVF